MNKTLRILYLAYGFLIALPLFATITMLCSIVCILGCTLGGGNWAAYYPGLIWSRMALILSLCRVEIEGKENIDRKKGAYVLVANHQSSYDIFVLYAFVGLNFKWVMKHELRKLWFIGKACEDAGFIFVDDTRRDSITNTMTQAKKVLSQGYSIFIFPEGSRTLDGKIQKFKKGAFVMASELDCPILPVTIDGAFNVLKRGNYIPYPSKIKLTIHKPFMPSEFGDAPKSIISSQQKAYDIISSSLSN